MLKREEKISRRSFLTGAAGCTFLTLTSLTLPWPSVYASSGFKPFSFAYITDVHLTSSVADTYKLTQESQLFLQQAVKELNESQLDFVVFGGDQVEQVGFEQANWLLFLDIVQVLNIPWFFVLGEQDVSGNPPPAKMKTFLPDWKRSGIETEVSWWSYSPAKGACIIGLDTSVANSTAGNLSPQQLSWLRKQLADSTGSFTVVFCHHPLLPPAPYDGGPPFDDYLVADGASAREILGTSPDVRLVVSGHVHVSKVQQEKDIYHISSPSLTVYPCAYRLFRVNSQNIVMETHVINFPALVKKAKKALSSSTLAYKYNRSQPGTFTKLAAGMRSDQNSLLSLAPGKGIQFLPRSKKGKAKK